MTDILAKAMRLVLDAVPEAEHDGRGAPTGATGATEAVGAYASCIAVE